MIGTSELAERLGTDKKNGLTTRLVIKKSAEYGYNEFQKNKAISWYHKLTGFFSLLLFTGASLCLIAFYYQDDSQDLFNFYLGILLSVISFTVGIHTCMQS